MVRIPPSPPRTARYVLRRVGNYETLPNAPAAPDLNKLDITERQGIYKGKPNIRTAVSFSAEARGQNEERSRERR